MSERKQLSGMDWAGIGLFAAGATGAVLMCLAMGTSEPLEEQGPLGPVAAAWKNALGVFPAMFLNAAIAFLGARLFLQGGAATLARNLVGCTGLALALAILCGAWSPVAGGAVGEHTGTVITNMSHLAVGTLVGLLAFFAVAWFAWLRAPNMEAIVSEAVDAPVLESSARPIARTTTRPAVHKTIAGDIGVTPAESAALFPDAEAVAAQQLRPGEVVRAPIPPSPYPEDVRRKGQVPPGARPLEAPSAALGAPAALPAPVIYRWTAPIVERGDSVPESASTASVDDVEDSERLGTGSRANADERIDVDEEESASTAERAALSLPSPSWERAPTLFSPEVGDEEPVDAYGTPLTLVEKLRQARRESGLERAPGALPTVEDHLVETSEDEVEPVAASAPVEDADLVDLEDEEDLFDGGEDEFDDLEEGQESDLAEDEIVVEASIPRELDAELETIEAQAASTEDDEADELDAEGDGSEDGFEEVQLDEVELEPARFEPALEPLVVPAIVAVQPAVPEVARPAATPRVERLQTSLFDAVESKAPATEREVVLQPVAAVPVERAAKAPVLPGDPQTQLLTEIGCLFIERGRVAVSMLQRQYQMDFDDACKVLDDLQEMGLIGPYLGGQRRDILLTRDQWLERVSQSSVAR